MRQRRNFLPILLMIVLLIIIGVERGVFRQIFEPSSVSSVSSSTTYSSTSTTHSFPSNSTSFNSLYYPDLVNEISLYTMSANLKVNNESYNIWGDGVISQGSGVIFYEDSSNYYLLTNNHVTARRSGYNFQKFVVEDYKGNGYSATLVSSDSDYDLAVLKFKKGTESLRVLHLASNDPAIAIEVVAIGQPHGQNNAITFGEIRGYGKHTLKDSTDSTVTFSVIEHDAPLGSGNSGGVLLDFSLRIIGINYAGAVDSEGNYLYGLAIPATKVQEYLTSSGWSFV